MDSTGGTTLYVGARTDEVFVRVYNKHAEAPEDYPEGAWRYEIELKGATADGQWQAFKEEYPTAHELVGLVSDYVSKRGLRVLWGESYGYRDWRAPSPVRDCQRTYRWVGSSVKSAIERLKYHYTEAEILEALGLDESPARAASSR